VADSVSAVASVQLNVLQSPEVARQDAPVLREAVLAGAQTPAIMARIDQEAKETVQQLEELRNPTVPDTLAGSPERERPSYRPSARRTARGGVRVEELAAANPRGVGVLVDVRA